MSIFHLSLYQDKMSPVIPDHAPWMCTAAALCALCISALLFRHALLQTFFIFISSFFTGGCMLSVHLSAQDCCFSSGKTSYRAVVVSTPVVHGKGVIKHLYVAVK